MAASAQPESPAPKPAGPVLRVFLADLHLDGTAAPKAKTFRALMARLAEEAERSPVELYLLGDVFEFWDEYHRQALARFETDIQALAAAHQAGVAITILKGNKDFLYGRYAQERFGARLFGDGGRIDFPDARKVWLEHGDLLCTADTRYLRYRKLVRSWPVRTLFRLLPWSLARRMVERVSKTARADRDKKVRAVTDIDLDAARKRLEQTGCQLLMCGHTHAPQATDLNLGRRLIVLPAWCDTMAGYRERNAGLVAVRFDLDGTPSPARFDGSPDPNQ